MSMMDDGDMEVLAISKEKGAPKFTIFPTYGWIALGTYFNKTGGLDTISTNAMTKELLEYVLVNYPDYDVLMEGVIASTIRSTYINLFREYQEKMNAGYISKRKIIIMSFVPPLDFCLRNIQLRNGGKPIKEDQVESKMSTVENNIEYFRQAGFLSLAIDTSKSTKEMMLKNFLDTVNYYREASRW